VRLIKSSVAALLLLALIGPATALAAAPVRDVISGSEVIDDFCGTGQTVVVSSSGVINWFEGAGWGHVQDTWTNPESGISVTTSWAGGGKFKLVEHDDGSYTWVTERMGLPDKIRPDGGGPLTLDAGLVIFQDHFDADDNYLGTEVEIVGGPHPGLDPGYDWCDVMIEALGL